MFISQFLLSVCVDALGKVVTYCSREDAEICFSFNSSGSFTFDLLRDEDIVAQFLQFVVQLAYLTEFTILLFIFDVNASLDGVVGIFVEQGFNMK